MYAVRWHVPGSTGTRQEVHFSDGLRSLVWPVPGAVVPVLGVPGGEEEER